MTQENLTLKPDGQGEERRVDLVVARIVGRILQSLSLDREPRLDSSTTTHIIEDDSRHVQDIEEIRIDLRDGNTSDL